MYASKQERKESNCTVEVWSCPSSIGDGRWERSGNQALAADERLCVYCQKNGINEKENEEHFLLKCILPEFVKYRKDLLDKASCVYPNFNAIDDTSKVVFLLSHPSIVFYSAKLCCKMLNVRTDISKKDFIL